MSKNPIIIQVLSMPNWQLIRRNTRYLYLFSTLLTLGSAFTMMQAGMDAWAIVITIGLIIILFGNLVYYFRQYLLDNYSRSLCIELDRFYLLDPDGSFQDFDSIELKYLNKAVVLTFGQGQLLMELNGEYDTAYFQVVDRNDWNQLKDLYATQVQIKEELLEHKFVWN